MDVLCFIESLSLWGAGSNCMEDLSMTYLSNQYDNFVEKFWQNQVFICLKSADCDYCNKPITL